MSKSQNMKSKFRSTSTWKKHRKECYKKDNGIDFITQSKLYKGYNTHHLDLREEHYTNISEKKRFLSLNKKTHDFIHWGYSYYIKEGDYFIDRIKLVWDLMKIYSED